MAIHSPKSFDVVKQEAIDKLTEAYHLVTDLMYYNSSDELEEVSETILEVRTAIRFTYEDEQEW